jgi:C-terminal processing protease CtpA/Prc
VPAARWSACVEALCAHVAEHYVYPDVGEQVVAVLRQRLADGGYDTIAGDQEFAAAVTADLQSVNGDKHLRLLYSHEPIPECEGQVFDEAAYRAEVELSAGGIAAVQRLDGNVGYLDLRALYGAAYAGHTAVAAMTLLAHTDVLLVDLRRNGGGDPGMVALYCSYLFDDEIHLNDLYWRGDGDGDGSTRQWWTLPYVPGPKFGGTKPVYVLTSADTFSGAEELAYNLATRGRATLVGERTRGGAHPGGRYRIGAHLKAAVPSGRAINPVTGSNWEGTGVQPDIELPAAEAFDAAYRLALEHVLALGSDGARREVAEEARAALGVLPEPLKGAAGR